MAEIQISVVICTYNRAKLLDECLASLAEQVSVGVDWDVIVVDNNCTDNTVEIVEKWRSSLNIKYVREAQQGLSFARNAGLSASVADWVAFLDDDCTCSAGWLQAVIDGYTQFPDTACFGGKINLRWEGGNKPAWMNQKVMPALGYQDFGDQIIEVRHINGGNMIWARSILSDLGGFNPNLGRVGNQKLASEESEVQEKAKKAGYCIRYLPNAFVYHWVPVLRQSKRYILHISFMVGKSGSISDCLIGKSPSFRKLLSTTKVLLQRFSLFFSSFIVGKLRIAGDAFYYLYLLTMTFGRWLTDFKHLVKPVE